MKKLLILLLLFLFAYMQMGYYWHSVKLRNEARLEFKEFVHSSVADSLLYTFALSEISENIKWEEEGKEFWLAGQLYDVVRQKCVDGKTYLYCLNDSKEKDIVAEQVNITKSNSANTTKHSKIIKFSLPEFTIEQYEASNPASFYSSLKFYSYKDDVLLMYQEPFSPPPQS